MFPPPVPKSSPARRQLLHTGVLLPVCAWLLASACGPGVATPMPEPPTVFNLDAIPTPEAQPVSSGVPFDGVRGAVPAGAIVRVTNLDGTQPPSAETAAADGSFSVSVEVAAGEELRFEWVNGDERSAPADARYATAGRHLDPSPRFDCLKLTPGVVLEFGAATNASLLLQNECSESVALSNPSARLPLTDFALETPLPLEIGTGETQPLDFSFARSAAGPRENNLFFEVTLAGTTIRYAVTVLAF